MRILRVHNRYQDRGGEDHTFESEVDLLREYGHEVETLIVSNDAIPEKRSPLMSARLAASTVWSRSGQRHVEDAIVRFSPDVVHFNNTFPLVSPAAYTACKRHSVPVVQHLHNYRPLCPNALFYRDGRPCEDCLGKIIPLPGIVHACYRDSRSQTAAVAAMITAHKIRRTWSRDVDKFIAMTHFERDKFIEGGFPADRITVKPHFVTAAPLAPDTHRNGFLYVGRLTPDKGILTLLEAWHDVDGMPLTIAGSGPLASEVAAAADRNPNLSYVGPKSTNDIYALMHHASLLVVSSQWYETFGRVVVEAFAQGTPVLAANIGAIGELVSPGKTGLHFEPGNVASLSKALRWAAQHPDEIRQMGIAARDEYKRVYTPERNYEMLMHIYEEVTNTPHLHSSSFKSTLPLEEARI
jgi:glycosyltransferase involved in cell wall biosynthesis